MAAFPSKNKTSLQLEIVRFSIISQNIFAAAFNMTSLTADWLVGSDVERAMFVLQ